MNRIKLAKRPFFPVKIRNLTSLVHNINYFLLIFTFKGSERIRKSISKFIIPKLREKKKWPTIYGFSCFLNLKQKSIIEHEMYRYGVYEAGVLNVLKNFLKKDDIFIDIGSNIGIISLAASQFVGKNGHIYSFEPEPETFNYFKKNIWINNIKNITAIDKGWVQLKKQRVFIII